MDKKDRKNNIIQFLKSIKITYGEMNDLTKIMVFSSILLVVGLGAYMIWKIVVSDVYTKQSLLAMSFIIILGFFSTYLPLMCRGEMVAQNNILNNLIDKNVMDIKNHQDRIEIARELRTNTKTSIDLIVLAIGLHLTVCMLLFVFFVFFFNSLSNEVSKTEEFIKFIVALFPLATMFKYDFKTIELMTTNNQMIKYLEKIETF